MKMNPEWKEQHRAQIRKERKLRSAKYPKPQKSLLPEREDSEGERMIQDRLDNY